MSDNSESRLVQVLLSRLGAPDKQTLLITPLANDLAEDPSISRLPEARFIVEFLNQAGESSGEEISAILEHLVQFFLGLVSQNHQGQDLQAIVTLTGLNVDLADSIHANLRASISSSAAVIQSDEGQLALKLSGQDDPVLEVHILSILNFLLAYCRSIRDQQEPRGPDVLENLLPLIAHCDKPTSRQALNLAVALIDCLSEQTLDTAAFVTRAWSTVLGFVYQSQQISLVTAGLTIWLRLLSRSKPYDLLTSAEYWNALHRVLASGSPEQQRVCLAIFRVSISLFYKNQAATSLSKNDAQQELDKYEKFMTVFQVIVLDRYLNLVREVITDLGTIAAPGSNFPSRWVFALLSTALSTNAQLSIRRIVGNWVIDHPEILTQPAIDDFLEGYFLPWASMGSLYNGSVAKTGTDGMAICLHAERLTLMLREMFSVSAERETSRAHLRALLRFLCHSGRRIFSTARVILLEGIEGALHLRDDLFSEDMNDLLFETAAVGGFQEISMDCASLLVGSIAQAIDKSGSHFSIPKDVQLRLDRITSNESETHMSDDDAHTIMSAAAKQSLSPISNLKLVWLSEAIEKTNHKCLANQGLAPATTLFQRACLDPSSPIPADSEISLVVSALFEELEVQEWPRAPFLSFMQSLLHPRLVRSVSSRPALRDLIVVKLDLLKELMRGKVYVFSTLAAGFRSLLLESPLEASEIGAWTFIDSIARNPPETKDEFLLEEYLAAKMARFAPHRTYQSYYGEKESHGYACFFDMLNMLPQQDAHSISQARGLFKSLMDPWPNQTLPLAVFSAWKSNVQIHVLALLLEYLLVHFSPTEANDSLNATLQVLEIELLPRYRFLFEWLTARIVYAHADLRSRLVAQLSSMDIGNPKFCISIIKLALMIANFPNAAESYARELSIQLMLLAACPKVAVRHEAQWVIPQLWGTSERKGWDGVMGDAVFARLNGSLRETEFYKNPPATRVYEHLDPVADHTLSNLMEGPYLKILPDATAKTHRRDFLALWAADDAAAASSGDPAPSHTGLLPLGAPIILPTTPKPSPAVPSTPAQTNLPLQIKGRFSLDEPAKIPMSLLTPGNSGAPTRPSPLIVIATLVDSHWNLGGIVRAAEILGAAAVHFATVRVLESAAFTATSVSAHLHVPIEPLAARDVSAFLTRKKTEGYEVVGIEQTDSSRVLGAAGAQGARFRADGRTVLLLGAEATGVPGELLADCDWCVEIRHKGITRSMNVHTAAAVVMYEYVRQREGAAASAAT